MDVTRDWFKEESYEEEHARWARRERKKKNATKMKVDSAGLRSTAQIIHQKAIQAQRKEKDQAQEVYLLKK